ncbi:MAG TPA: hypothetical protein VKY85_07235 [Candidatus Angelobacter sp.]|nr:hypothetical protein [Candidatus Angelobacter sp.]
MLDRQSGTRTTRLKKFKQCYEWAIAGEYEENSAKVRRHLLRAMTEHTFENHVYRSDPSQYDVERALLKSIGVFDYEENPVRVYHLKQIRRFLFSRFALCRACAVNRRLRKPPKNQLKDKESWLWLYKDIMLPRLGFSIGLGYGAVFGSSGLTWLDPLAWNHHSIALLAALLLLALGWFLILLNVRNQVGRIGAQWRRSLLAWGGCLIWMSAYMKLGNAYYNLMQWPRGFSWRTAWLASSIALLFGLLGQFFFGKTGSIAEPL